MGVNSRVGGSNQKLGPDKVVECSRIIGQKVIHAYVNGTLPHYVALCWVNEREAYFVNYKIKKAFPYLVGGKFRLHRSSNAMRSKETDTRKICVDLLKNRVYDAT